MNKPKWVVIHTAAADRKGVTLEDIRQWHLDRGWQDIGYHYVIEDDGLIQEGRGLEETGAHTKGLNSRSVGICVTGHGDHRDFNEAQYKALDVLLSKLCNDFDISSDHIIGHREAGKIEGVPKPNKFCPGFMVEMVRLRERMRGFYEERDLELPDSAPQPGPPARTDKTVFVEEDGVLKAKDEPKEPPASPLRITPKTSKKKPLIRASGLGVVVNTIKEKEPPEISEAEIVAALKTLSGMRYLHGSTIISPMIRRILGGGEYLRRGIAEEATGILEEMKRNG